MNTAVKNILKASIAVYRSHEDPAKFLAHIQAQTEKLLKEPLVKARGTATQNYYQANSIFLRIFNPRTIMEKHDREIDHSARAHAVISASGASKWTACTPSARLELYFDKDSTEFAEEGTLAHELAELNLKFELGIFVAEDFINRRAPLVKSEIYSEEMDDYLSKHIDYVIEQFTEAKRVTPGAILLIEEKVDLTHLIEDSFGTCDDIIIADGVLEVIDLKYGLGVRVEAEKNKQLMLYGSGALEKYELLYDIHTVRLTITQPRLDSISSWEISADDLRKWGEEELKPLAAKAFAGEGELLTGSHCQFCKASPRCRARAAEAEKLTEHIYDDPRLLSDEELIEIFKLSDNVGKWVKKVDAHVFDEAMAGKKWPGYKLVDGQNRRAWTDPNTALSVALDNGMVFDKITTPAKIKGITEIEKLATKALFPTLFGDVVFYKKTSPSLVPESDKRPELISREEQALKDFDDDLM